MKYVETYNNIEEYIEKLKELLSMSEAEYFDFIEDAIVNDLDGIMVYDDFGNIDLIIPRDILTLLKEEYIRIKDNSLNNVINELSEIPKLNRLSTDML